jgi:hypothetical protein
MGLLILAPVHLPPHTAHLVFWTVANFSLRVREVHEIPGEYKAVIELAAAMQREFDTAGEDPTHFNERKITRKIRRDLNGGRITHDGLKTPPYKDRFLAVFARWFQRDRWWLLLFAILTGIWIGALLAAGTTTSFSLLFFFTLSLTTSIGVLLAMYIGRKTGSRVMIVLLFAVVALALISPLVSGIKTKYAS